MAYKLTKEQVKDEIRKCGNDPIYFLKNYVKISHPLKGQIPFTTFDYQDDLLNDFNNHRFNVILKARQLGISTIVAGYATWLMLFRREKTVLVLATKFKTAANLAVKVKKMMKSIPDWLRIAEITVDNQTSFELSNGSNIKASTTSKSDAGRSEALSLLIVDEAAFVEGMDELWTSIFPTISTGGRCIALSTPNGVGNWFYKTYSEAENGINNFHPIKLPWDIHPDRDDDWFREQTKSMSRRDIAQEFECSFNMSGETVVHADNMAEIRSSILEPKHRTGFDRNYWIWEEPQPGLTYMMVADVARGDGGDNSVFHTFRIDTMEQVAEYQGKPVLEMFASMLNSVGREYNNCLLIVENNNVGYNVLEKLIEMEYPNLYFSAKSSHEYVEQATAELQSNTVPGFTTTSRTRPLIIAKMEEFVRNKVIKFKSGRLYQELETFVWNNGRPEAMRGYHDDLVMSMAICCWVRDTALTANKREAAYTKAILGSIMKANSKISTLVQGQVGYKQNQVFDPHSEDLKQKYKDLLWLIKG
jgi:Terminase large subunit, T4likevirus-type, N-terminal